MHFKRKIVLSVVTAMMLASCTTEDEYKAAACVDCGLNPTSAPTPTPTPGQTPTPTPGQTPTPTPTSTPVTINFAKSSGQVSWTKNDPTEQAQGMAISSQNIVVYIKWDNRLVLVDSQTQTKSDDKVFLDVSGGRFSSGEIPVVDSTTGASEQILAKVLVNDSGTKVFSMLEKHSEGSDTKGIGIYGDSIANGIPSARFARRSASDENYFAYPKITDIALSHDGTKVLACGNDRKIHIFDADTLNTPSTIDTGKKMRSLNFSANDEHIFAGSGGLSGLIRIYNTASKEKLAEIAVNETPIAVVEVPESNKMVAIFQTKDGAGGNKVRVYDISDISNPTLDKLLVINGNAKSISLSPDNKLFAITASGNQVNLFSIEGVDTPKVITLDSTTSGAVFISDTKLAITSGTKMEFFDITVNP